MIQFLIKRFIGLLFVITGVTFITFMLGYVAPGDPIRNLLGQHFSPTTYAVLRHAYGLDLPWYQQYGNYVLNLLHGNFGTSFVTANRPVWDILKDGVPVSAELGLGALIIQMLVGVPIYSTIWTMDERAPPQMWLAQPTISRRYGQCRRNLERLFHHRRLPRAS